MGSSIFGKNMKPEDDQELWDLLGRVAGPEVLPFIILWCKGLPKKSRMWLQRSIRKTLKWSPTWMTCSLPMKSACGTKSQPCKNNRRFVYLRFVVGSGEGATAASRASANGAFFTPAATSAECT